MADILVYSVLLMCDFFSLVVHIGCFSIDCGVTKEPHIQTLMFSVDHSWEMKEGTSINVKICISKNSCCILGKINLWTFQHYVKWNANCTFRNFRESDKKLNAQFLCISKSRIIVYLLLWTSKKKKGEKNEEKRVFYSLALEGKLLQPPSINLPSNKEC